MKTFGALKFSGAGIHSGIDEGNSQGFQGSTREVGFVNSETGSGGFNGGATDGDVSMGGELKDLCCANCQKEMLPNTQSIKGL